MPDIFDRVLPLNLIANTVTFYVAARLYLLPLVSRVRPQQILVPILLLHSTRHLGMMFLTRGATYPGLPPEFAYPAAFGDLLTAIIAFLAIPLVNKLKGKIGFFTGSVALAPETGESFDILRALQGGDACGTNSLADLARRSRIPRKWHFNIPRMRHRPHRRIDDRELCERHRKAFLFSSLSHCCS